MLALLGALGEYGGDQHPPELRVPRTRVYRVTRVYKPYRVMVLSCRIFHIGTSTSPMHYGHTLNYWNREWAME